MENVVIGSDALETDLRPFVERRRPGRLPFVSPRLIPLLRGTTQLSADLAEDDLGDHDQLRPAHGLVLALLCSLPLWALVGAAVRFLS